MPSNVWFRYVRRVRCGPVALAVMLTAGAGGLAPAAVVTDLASATPAAASALATSPTAVTLLSVSVPGAQAPGLQAAGVQAPGGLTTRAAKSPEKKGGGSRRGKSGAPCSAAAKACVDLSSQQAWLTDGAGHITYGPVAARGGGKHARTPKGSFSVIWKDEHHLSKEFNNAPMPYSVFFYPGDAFHGGNPATASNGCIHLAIGAAQRFFASLKPGDKVEIK
jgi:lipoprotein-anchoring transpeptidase ErfK/SrfK